MVQRIRVRYAKRGRLRFTSHRDFARALERALRRAGVPIAYSAGFTRHPKISYVGAAPTGVASEAEYLELGLAEPVDPATLRRVLDGSLPAGLDIEECVPAGPGALAERIDACAWRIEIPGVDPEELGAAVRLFLDRASVEVDRLTKDGRRKVDARAAVTSMEVTARGDEDHADEPGDSGTRSASSRDADIPCAILGVVVRQATPTVRPDDVLAALGAVADLLPPVPPRATRLAQGRLDDTGRLADPLAPDRAAALAASQGAPGAAQRTAPSVGTTPVG